VSLLALSDRILTARFVERPNRFLVRCHVPRQGVVEAFLPNPGRLCELLLPHATLYLAPAAPPPLGRARLLPSQPPSRPPAPAVRKTAYTVLAVERDGQPILLHTHLTNRVARHLIETGCIPGLKGAEVVRSEIPVGNSRFDFLLTHAGRELYVEVKSVTLFGNGVAMFPDAVSERGRKHLRELFALSRESANRPLVLFLVHTDRVRWFLPDYHTDLAFSQTLLDVHDAVQILPVAVGWTAELSLAGPPRLLDIPWDHLRREAQDRGSYLLLLELRRDRRIEVGRLGRLSFRRGWHIYVGSAMLGLTARLARHVRHRKRLHWHIDHLRAVADAAIPLPIRSSRREECDLAADLSGLFDRGPIGFGCSDCGCPTHLFHSPANPLTSVPFHALLQRYRMRPP